MPPRYLCGVVGERLVAIVLVLPCVACGAGDGSADGDAGPSSDGGSDAMATDAGRPDGGLPDGAADGGFRMRVTLDDGRELVGERVATYDHSRWWIDPSDELTHALFRPDLLLEYPNDRSLAFVAASRIERSVMERLPPGARSYRNSLRERGVTLDRVPLDGVTYVIAGHERHHLEENGYGDFAWDLVRTDADGGRFSGDGSANEDYLVWDDEVYLPTRGYVVEVVRDAPDNVPGTLDLEAVNNMVGVQIYGGYYLYLLHFRQDTIPQSVRVGAVLDAGAYLGRVGNSGVSLEPHLHVTMLAADPESTPLRTWSVPSEFRDVWVGTSPEGPAGHRAFHDPGSGEWISSSRF